MRSPDYPPGTVVPGRPVWWLRDRWRYVRLHPEFRHRLVVDGDSQADDEGELELPPDLHVIDGGDR